MRKSLRESIYDYEDYQAPIKQMLEHCMQLHKEEYSELGVFLGWLKALEVIHQSHHWQTSGGDSYGDHLLYQRLYEEVAPEFDSVGEKIVGVGGIHMTNYFALVYHMKVFMEGVSQGEELHVESYRAELMFVIAGEMIMNSLEKKGLLTRGVEQLIGSILDKHESHVFLLQQRSYVS